MHTWTGMLHCKAAMLRKSKPAEQMSDKSGPMDGSPAQDMTRAPAWPTRPHVKNGLWRRLYWPKTANTPRHKPASTGVARPERRSSWAGTTSRMWTCTPFTPPMHPCI